MGATPDARFRLRHAARARRLRHRRSGTPAEEATSSASARWCCRRRSSRCWRRTRRGASARAPPASSPRPPCTCRSRWRARRATRPSGSTPTATSRSAAARPSASARRSRCETSLPVIAVPTTYAGSEMTTILGITEGGQKNTRGPPRVAARRDLRSDLTVSLPARLSATSGMNAIAHAVEALYAENANPIISLMAEEGIARAGRSLPVVVKQPRRAGSARRCALRRVAVRRPRRGRDGAAPQALPHARRQLRPAPRRDPHLVLAHAAAYNRPAAPEAMARIARALGAADAAAGLHDLAVLIGAPTGSGISA